MWQVWYFACVAPAISTGLRGTKRTRRRFFFRCFSSRFQKLKVRKYHACHTDSSFAQFYSKTPKDAPVISTGLRGTKRTRRDFLLCFTYQNGHGPQVPRLPHGFTLLLKNMSDRNRLQPIYCYYVANVLLLNGYKMHIRRP